MKRLVSLFLLLATPALADPEGYGHMMGWGYGAGIGMLFGPVLWIVVLALAVAGVIWFARRVDIHGDPKKPGSAIAELDMRFARGEIDAEEYTARKKLLGS